MTPEREQVARSVARVDGITDTSLVRDLLAEIDRLRALPVMDVCGRCDDCCQALANGGAACMHPKIGYRATVASDAPPSWCPLRGGER